MNFTYTIAWILTKFISIVLFRVRFVGKENLPKSGGFILAPNHRSYFDPPLVGSSFNHAIAYFAKSALFENKLFGKILRICNTIPVKRGVIDRKATEEAVAMIQSGVPLIVFPEGTRAEGYNFLSPKAGVGMIAMQAKCDILPIYVHNSNRLLDCFLFKKRLHVIIGELIPFEQFKSLPPEKESYRKISEIAFSKVISLYESNFKLK